VLNAHEVSVTSTLKILFSFENPLPSREADAEVFVTTARYLAKRISQSWFHVPVDPEEPPGRTAALVGMPVLPADAPIRPAALRHLRCGASIVSTPGFREAALIYTRNFWVAHSALRHGQRVVSITIARGRIRCRPCSASSITSWRIRGSS
jgi:hypothetical protein